MDLVRQRVIVDLAAVAASLLRAPFTLVLVLPAGSFVLEVRRREDTVIVATVALAMVVLSTPALVSVTGRL